MREIYELKGKGRSIRGIADDLGISRATVRKYARSEGVPKPKARAKRGKSEEGIEARCVHRLHRRQVGGRT